MILKRSVTIVSSYLNSNFSLVLFSTISVVYLLAIFGSWRILKNLEYLEKFARNWPYRRAIYVKQLSGNDPRGHDYYYLYPDDIVEASTNSVMSPNFRELSEHLTFSILPTNLSCTNQEDLFVQGESINPKTPTVFIVIKTRPYEIFQRNAIRLTYGHYFTGKLVFVVGRTTHADIDDALILESQQFGDILRADFLDSYFNLTYKSYTILRWIKTYCPNEAFYLQADSDAIIYPSNVNTFVSKHARVSKRIYGLCWLNSVVRRKGKWRVPRNRFRSSHYPEYCIGAAFLMTGDVPALLYDQISRQSKLTYISIDDAYFSGILAEKARITRINYEDGFKYKRDIDPTFFDKCPCKSILASFEYKSPKELHQAWNDYVQAEDKCFDI